MNMIGGSGTITLTFGHASNPEMSNPTNPSFLRLHIPLHILKYIIDYLYISVPTPNSTHTLVTCEKWEPPFSFYCWVVFFLQKRKETSCRIQINATLLTHPDWFTRRFYPNLNKKVMEQLSGEALEGISCFSISIYIYIYILRFRINFFSVFMFYLYFILFYSFLLSFFQFWLIRWEVCGFWDLFLFLVYLPSCW